MRVQRIYRSVEAARAEEARDADMMRIESEVAWVALMSDVDLPMLDDDIENEEGTDE